jgi:uncharacterized protein
VSRGSVRGILVQTPRARADLAPSPSVYPMSDPPDTLSGADPRYLHGLDLFNRGEFFDAHEVWEDLWHERGPADRRFYQALIQAAVSLYHFGRGNLTGAARLYHSGRRYMEPFAPNFMGLEVFAFWDAVAAHLAPALGAGVSAAPVPTIRLSGMQSGAPADTTPAPADLGRTNS